MIRYHVHAWPTPFRPAPNRRLRWRAQVTYEAGTMRTTRTLGATLAVALALAACAHHVTYAQEQGARVHRLAIVVRVMGNASGDAPEALRGGATPAQVGKKLEAQVSPFEAAERLRSGLIEHLPDLPPWNTVVPGVQAESVLGSLLTVDRPVTTPEFDDLQKIGVDGVLYVEVEHWGVATRDEQGGFFTQGTGRLFTLPEHDTLWRQAFDELSAGGLPKTFLEPGEARGRLGELCAHVGELLALDLGGSRQAVSRTPALDAPEIEDKGHPPEPTARVIPFAIPERDGGRPIDAGSDRIDISVLPDGGAPDLPR